MCKCISAAAWQSAAAHETARDFGRLQPAAAKDNARSALIVQPSMRRIFLVAQASNGEEDIGWIAS